MITTKEIENFASRFNWSPEDVKTITLAAVQNHEWATNDAAQKATLRSLMKVVKKANMLKAEEGIDKIIFSVKLEEDGQTVFTSPCNLYQDIDILISLDKPATNKALYDGEIVIQKVLETPKSSLFTLHSDLINIRG